MKLPASFIFSESWCEMQYKILIADDDTDLVKMLRRYFELKGYAVSAAGDGAAALAEAQRNKKTILLYPSLGLAAVLHNCIYGFQDTVLWRGQDRHFRR